MPVFFIDLLDNRVPRPDAHGGSYKDEADAMVDARQALLHLVAEALKAEGDGIFSVTIRNAAGAVLRSISLSKTETERAVTDGPGLRRDARPG